MNVSLLDGINYNDDDVTKATLVLDAPLKILYMWRVVLIIGSLQALYHEKDPALVWLVNRTYLWVTISILVVDTPMDTISSKNSRSLFYFGIISPDDPYIPAASYPNLPVYHGAEREVTVANWKICLCLGSATTNFVKKQKENLFMNYWFVILMPIEAIKRLIKSIILKI
jgi:hypothetical protein